MNGKIDSRIDRFSRSEMKLAEEIVSSDDDKLDLDT